MKMAAIRLLLVFAVSGLSASEIFAAPVTVMAQARQDPAALAELNAVLWQPLESAFAAGDAAAWRALFKPGALLASGDMPTLNLVETQALGVERRFKLRHGREGFGLVVRFTERAVAGGLASERGIIEETNWSVRDRWEKVYREFHAFARKVDGVWQFEVFYQKTLSGDYASRAFAAASAMADLKRF